MAGGSSSRPRALLYRDMVGRVTVDAEVETVGSAPRLGRFVGGGEWRAGGCLGVGGHERERPLSLARSRWEGVEGCQKVRARRKVDAMVFKCMVSKYVERTLRVFLRLRHLIYSHIFIFVTFTLKVTCVR